MSINVDGSFNDWNPSSTEMKKPKNDNYIANIKLAYSGLIDFKFTANKTWDINWNDEKQSFLGFPINGFAELDTDSNTKNIQAYIPKPGNYRLFFNSNNSSYYLDSTRTK